MNRLTSRSALSSAMLRPFSLSLLDDWSLALYSLGISTRAALAWPSLLPLPFTSDHGMNLNATLEDHELGSRWRIHASWCKPRVDANSNHVKRVVRVPHPWITYRRRAGFSAQAGRNGAVLFATHSHPWSDYRDFNWEDSVQRCKAQLKERNLELRAICVHQHDVIKGLAGRLQATGIPVFTLGHTLHPAFVERFYRAMTRFEVGVSARPGIEALLFAEMGIPFFALERVPPELTRTGTHADKNGDRRLDNLGRELEDLFLSAFFIESGTSEIAKHKLATLLLSLDLANPAFYEGFRQELAAEINSRKSFALKSSRLALKLIGRWPPNAVIGDFP